jgi:hypothetical protein
VSSPITVDGSDDRFGENTQLSAAGRTAKSAKVRSLEHARQQEGESGQPVATATRMPHNIRMHLTGYSGLRPLPPAGDAERSASVETGRVFTGCVRCRALAPILRDVSREDSHCAHWAAMSWF